MKQFNRALKKAIMSEGKILNFKVPFWKDFIGS